MHFPNLAIAALDKEVAVLVKAVKAVKEDLEVKEVVKEVLAVRAEEDLAVKAGAVLDDKAVVDKVADLEAKVEVLEVKVVSEDKEDLGDKLLSCRRFQLML
ncbi:hypothetical protein HUJ04_000595 [Dendroctonus ponderosae]|nr:hypothetical protein HUJ04_000595 [Dendroctonus ponderosae]